MTTLDLAISILQARARDDHKDACAHVENESVCTLPKGHEAGHVMERVDSVIPFS